MTSTRPPSTPRSMKSTRVLQKPVSDQRPQRRARKLDRKAALEQRARGLSNSEIAVLQGVDRSTVRRFLAGMAPEIEAVEGFKRGRADVLARLQAKSLMTQELILDSLAEDGVVDALSPHQKGTLLVSLNAQAGTLYDKERLETGRSTTNVSSLGDIMRQAFRDMAKPTSWDACQSDEEAALDDSDDEDVAPRGTTS